MAIDEAIVRDLLCKLIQVKFVFSASMLYFQDDGSNRTTGTVGHFGGVGDVAGDSDLRPGCIRDCDGIWLDGAGTLAQRGIGTRTLCLARLRLKI